MKPASTIKTPRVIGAALTAAAMFLPSVHPVFADAAPERGIVAFKYLNYGDSQPGVDRIDVNAYSVRAMAPIAGKWAIDVTGVHDSVTGASPHYHTHFDTASGASKLNGDTRKAVDLNVTRYFPTGSLTAGTSYSEESDYISRSFSLQGALSTPSKNTTVTLGGSVTTDTITPNNFPLTDHKKIYSCLVGLTQVMSKNDIVQLNLGRSIGTGYYSDPYKTLDERPRHRNSTTFMTRWNHYFESTEGAGRFAYRYYTDTFGINAHSLSAEYVQPLSNGFTVTPSVRYYTQTAADFYVPVGPDEKLTGDATDPGFAVFYSEDQRLSAFGAVTLGIKVSKRFAQEWLVDVRYDHYMQRDNWALSGKGDSGLAAFNANFIQVGLSKEF
ncbi:MAG TPA: DUF3570 domain-containing protein [Chlorobaculum sp.]|jgi:hypothetical protein|nr:DUF3570 domain-containing protein [Chlorobaculum sp.]